MMKQEDLIKGFQQALDDRFGYIYGKTHELWSAEKQREYAHDYADDPDRTSSVMYGGKWDGHWVTDCSGLFVWVYCQHGLKIAHGSNSIWRDHLSAKGNLHKGKRLDGKPLLSGTAVFTTSGDEHNHIGLYIGGGVVIEAQGCKAGVTTSRITDKRWSAWGELKKVSYQGEEKHMTATVVLPTGASGNTVNMRDKPSRQGGIIAKVPVGSAVEILFDQGQWMQIEYNGKSGYMMSDYLEYGQSGESGGDILTEEEKDRIEQALKTIEQQIEIIRSAVGRG